MFKLRFFNTLHLARQLRKHERPLRGLLLTCYMKGWTDSYYETLKGGDA